MRLAVLGCGSIGKRHLRNLIALGGHELLAFDPSSDARTHVQKVLSLPAFADLDGLWPCSPQAALICAPPHQHLALALAAAEHGAHLFIEQPLSHQQAGLEQLQALEREKKLVTLVGCNMRFHPGPAKVKAVLESAELGPPIAARIQSGSYLPDWRPSADYRKSYTASREQGGGALLDCIHELDLALWYFGPGAAIAAAALPATALGIEVEGLAEVLVQHANGVLSSIHLNFLQRDYRRGCQIICEKGTLYWDFENPWVELRSSAGTEKRYQLDPAWQVNQMYVDELAHFLAALARGNPTLCPLEQGLDSLTLALRARELALGIPMDR